MKFEIVTKTFFNQYLRTTMIPKLEYQRLGKNLKFRYVDVVEDFDMPLRIFVDEKEHWIFPNSEWKTKKLEGENFEFDSNFYIKTEALEP